MDNLTTALPKPRDIPEKGKAAIRTVFPAYEV